jgi:hypothetical protein
MVLIAFPRGVKLLLEKRRAGINVLCDVVGALMVRIVVASHLHQTWRWTACICIAA